MMMLKNNNHNIDIKTKFWMSQSNGINTGQFCKWTSCLHTTVVMLW